MLSILFFEEPDPTHDNPKYPCGKCNLNIRKNNKAIQCDSCNYWNHIKCDGIDYTQYENLEKSVESYFCKICRDLSDEQYITFEKGIDKVLNGALNIFPDNRMNSLFKNLNNLNAHDQEEDDDDSISNNINCKYYQIDELKKEIVRKSKFSLLHSNIASLGTQKDEFEDMLSILELYFDILGLTETKIIKEQNPTYDTSITGYKEYFTPTESTK